MIGNKYHRLTVYNREGIGSSNVLVSCSCNPTKQYFTNAYGILCGRTKSCGCITKENTVNRNKSIAKHGLSNTKLYHIYNKMRARCYNSQNKDYKYYGGKGISIHEEWLHSETGFITFYNWSYANGYIEGLSIDRIDSNGSYEPSNCRWVTTSENIAKRNREHSKKNK